MKKRYITYQQYGKLKKAVLDDKLLEAYKNDKTVSEIIEYTSEMLMERLYAEKLGVNSTKRQLLD